ncbi:MAG: aminopeptidase P family N-terminal domain-containing protein [Synergistaceae bacterium]|nr:aminopeptidase P family N-terminal domain-containing protein [Synergistaceae bacterium]
MSRQSVAMWTDGRYLLQAQRELNDKDIEFYISSDAEAPSHAEWIREHIGREEKIAIDKKLFSVKEYRSIKRNLGPGFIVEDRSGYVDETWQPRPIISSERLFELDVSFAGASRVEKINIIRGQMKKKGAEQYLAASLDAVAWLTNLRGHDNPIYPLFHSYLFITGKIAVLYTNLSKIDDITAEGLRKDNILLRETSDIFNFLPNETAGKSIYLDPYKISVSLFESLSPSASVIEGIDLITNVKSMKNEIEQKNIRMSNIKECVALCRLIKYVKENVKKKRDFP